MSSKIMSSVLIPIVGSLSLSSSQFFPLKIPSCKLSSPQFRIFQLIPTSNFIQFTHYAVCCALEESSDGEIVRHPSWKIDAFWIFNSMEESGVRPDHKTYAYLLDSCLSSGSIFGSQRIHGRILKLGLEKDSILCNRLIHFYFRFGDFIDAVNCSRKCLIEKLHHFWVFFQRKEHLQVLSMLSRMLRECKDPSPNAFARALIACSWNNVSCHTVQQIHAKIVRYGFVGDSIVGNPLIDLYSKNGFIDSAKLVFKELFAKDNVSWVATMSGFSQNGLREEALGLYCQMHHYGIIPTPYVLSSILSASAKCELFENGKQIPAQVYKWGFCSETCLGNALIGLYSLYGSLQLAHQVFTEMPRRDEVTYNSMISGILNMEIVKAL